MKPIIHVVAAVIKRNDESYLIAKRSEKMSLSNVWEFPGGKLEQGENEKIALQQEIQEELGCSIEVGSLITDTYHEYEEVIVHLKTFEAQITKGTPTAKEHTEIRWIKKDEFQQIHWAPADVPTVKALL